MRMQRLANLLSWQRYQACRRLFVHPRDAHVALSGMRGGPFELEFKDGGTLAFPPFRRVRALWSFLLDPGRGEKTVRAEGGALVFEHDGARFAVRPDTYDFAIFTEVWFRDVYRLARVPRPIDTVVDLGANVGLFSALAGRAARRVIALEPVAGNRAMAERNLAGAGVQDKVRLLGLAASDRSGEKLKLHISRGNSGAHSIVPGLGHLEGSAGVEEVDTISLGDLFEQEKIERCDLLKCDVEGAEYPIILGASLDVLRRIERMAIEVHTSPDLPEENASKLRAHLEAAGFALEQEGELRFMGTLTQRMIFATRA
jgi:FkbM family methyltransferase